MVIEWLESAHRGGNDKGEGKMANAGIAEADVRIINQAPQAIPGQGSLSGNLALLRG